MHRPCCFNEQRAPLQTASLRERSALAGGGRCPLVRGWVVRSAGMLRMYKVVRKGQAHKMPYIGLIGCQDGHVPSWQPLTNSEQQTLSAETPLGSQGLLP